MTINVSALRKFQETFGPAIEAIPAVIEAVERQADMQREVNAHKAKMEKAQAEIQAAYDQADKRLADYNGDIAKLQEQKTALTKKIKADTDAAQAKAAEAKAAADAELAKVVEETKQATAQLASIQKDVKAQIAAAQAEHDAAMKAMQAEIADLEKRRAAAEKALDALRAKLG